MKKLIIVPMSVGILGFGSIVLANTNSVTNEVSDDKAVTVETQKAESQQEKRLSFAEISSLASKTVNGTVTDIHLDDDDGRLHYDVEIHHGKFEYELELDAMDGEVLKKERDDDDDDDSNQSNKAQQQTSVSSLISSEQAAKTALAKVGGTVEEVELERDDGVAYYEVGIEDGRKDHEVYVDATNGDILKVETDDEDDDNDDD